MGSVESRHDLGHKLMPKAIWKKALDSPLTLNVSVQQDRSDDQFPGYLKAGVEPSSEVTPVEQGVRIWTNDHYELGDGGCDKLRRVVEDHREYSEKLIGAISNALMEGR